MMTRLHIYASDTGFILLRHLLADLGALVVAMSYRSNKPGFERILTKNPLKTWLIATI